MSRRNPSPAILLLAVPLAAAGCVPRRGDDRLEKPLIAVASFENRAEFPLDWRIGDGIPEVLTNALYQTGQFRVLDREDLDLVLSEQDLQATGKTREEERVRPNRLKNAHFLVTGVITEFAHVSMSGADFGIGSLRLGTGGVHAIVNIALKVVDVESGEVVYTSVVDGKAYAGDIEVRNVYKGVSFGGYQFFRTPLGRALRQALDRAVAGIRGSIRPAIWMPTIAGVDGGRVVISGGQDRGVQAGSRWRAVSRGEPIVDPQTGDVLGHRGLEDVGVIRVTEVLPRYSEAVVESGGPFERGQRLVLVEPAPEAAGSPRR